MNSRLFFPCGRKSGKPHPHPNLLPRSFRPPRLIEPHPCVKRLGVWIGRHKIHCTTNRLYTSAPRPFEQVQIQKAGGFETLMDFRQDYPVDIHKAGKSRTEPLKINTVVIGVLIECNQQHPIRLYASGMERGLDQGASLFLCQERRRLAMCVVEGVQEDAGVVCLVRVYHRRQQLVLFEMEISFVLQFLPYCMVNILRALDPRSTPLLSRLAKFSRIAMIITSL